MSEFYDGTKLLSMMDLNGEKPEIYLCTSNRSAGKTTFFGRFLVNRFIKHHEKFCLIYRYNYELDDVAEKFFKDLNRLFFNGREMKSARKSKGIYHELFLDEESCGYAISLNNADQIKRLSHLFSDVTTMLMDEFQSETNHYCADELKKFISVHTSIARGNGESVRYVPVIMLSNCVSIINPYYVELGISARLKADTKFLRGDGFVLEQGHVSSAGDKQKSSSFNKAFNKNSYVAYSSENVYLNDSTAFIEKPVGRGRYLCTLKYKGAEYGVVEYAESGFVYCGDKADTTFPTRVAVTTDDHQVNYVMLKRNDFFISTLRYMFERGCLRFKDLKCKEAVMAAISY